MNSLQSIQITTKEAINKNLKNPQRNLKEIKNNRNKNANSLINNDNKNVIACGDSMVYGIESNGLSSKEFKTIIRSFSGSTSKDMIDYVKLLALKKPDVMVIYVGTNDLTKNVTNTTENLKQIIEHIRDINSSTISVIFCTISVFSACLSRIMVNIFSKDTNLRKHREKTFQHLL